MVVIIKKILVGATVAASMTAFASSQALATNLAKPTNIQFTTNGVKDSKPNINTWTYGSAKFDNTGIGGVNRRVLNDYNNKADSNKAIAALTDGDSTTNVELFTSGEVVTDHVGFTGNFGNNTVKIESVTKADWADGTLATAWLKGFSNAYGGLMSSIPTTVGSNILKDFNNNFGLLVGSLKATGFNAAGDANIGDIALNKETGELKLDLVGHLDISEKYVDTRKTIPDPVATILKTTTTTIAGKKITTTTSIANPNFGKPIPNPNYLKQSPDYARNTTGNPVFDGMLSSLAKAAFLTNTPLQVSEIAKVTFNGQTDYAFSFKASESGAIAGDRNQISNSTDHTGVYSWNKTYKTVPEPSALFGLVGIGGLVIASRRKRMKNV